MGENENLFCQLTAVSEKLFCQLSAMGTVKGNEMAILIEI